MYQLHYFPANANAAPHMLLEELGAQYELVLVDRASNAQKSAEYLKINPNGRIPTLVDGDPAMFEAAAIVLHLVDRHPDAGLAPEVGTPERAKFYQWLTFLTNSLQEELMIWQYPGASRRQRRRGGRDRQAGRRSPRQRLPRRHREPSQGERPAVPRRQAQRRRFLPGHARALGAPDDQAAALASAHRQAARQGDGASRRCAAPTSAKASPTRSADHPDQRIRRTARRPAFGKGHFMTTDSTPQHPGPDGPALRRADDLRPPAGLRRIGTSSTAPMSPSSACRSTPPRAIASARASGRARSAKSRCSTASARKACSISRTRSPISPPRR